MPNVGHAIIIEGMDNKINGIKITQDDSLIWLSPLYLESPWKTTNKNLNVYSAVIKTPIKTQ